MNNEGHTFEFKNGFERFRWAVLVWAVWAVSFGVIPRIDVDAWLMDLFSEAETQ